MDRLYLFLTGPALWFTFLFFGCGIVFRLAMLFRLSREKDRILYNHIHLMWGMKSILHWMIPWASDAMRRQPVFTAGVFTFHILLLAIPLFLNAHNILWDESWSISLPSISDRWADILSLVFIGSGLFLFIRRLYKKEVRILTSTWDFVLLWMTMLPFITGILAYHQLGIYNIIMILHILSGEILLVLIPVTKLSHMVLFFFTRAYIGFEIGGRRGARSW
jgi:hypothetical protein